MRWLARVFVSAMARRIAYVLVALLFATCGVARAASFGVQTCKVGGSCDQGAAYSACMSQVQDHKAQFPTATYYEAACRHVNSQDPYYSPVVDYREPGGGRTTRIGADEYYGTKCDKRPDYNGPFPSVYGTPRNGSVQCFSGCQMAWYDNGDGTFNGKNTSVPGVCGDGDLEDDADCKAKFGATYYYNGALGVCEPEPPKDCPAGQVKDAKGNCQPNTCPEGMTQQQDGTCKPSENECPAGEIKSPAGGCLPGDGQCAAGEARGKDGTCKRDADGDGKPDEGEEDGDTKPTFSGGDSCDFPPACSGNPIMCGQARIQWRIDCNTRRNVNIQGGSCAAMPVCVGKDCKAMEYSQLLMQWRTACALEKAAGKPGAGGDNADVKAIRDAITGTNGQANIGEEGSNSGAFSDESGYGQGGMPDGKLDTSGFGYSRSCPTIPDVSVFGQTIHFDTSRFCQWMVLGGQIVLVMAALLSLRLMSQGGST
ncbi:hypothetical protein [Xanthomonas arboricola]|uniref:Phage-related protein n=2 Tax=Xanthomonas arboricola pv. pruni TaxID=69929 RepID=A0AAP4NN69_9XANT|nr:hypothetical protein [Xanthomonas arboricola]MDN0289138.1 hypothetical protein [Xanthomonas arboricola pv. pruni]MDN0293290.1 hypothetical protein [Xanthomonas arboricola pv. pruni]MDN0297392.1 hypothetical protein [Xanthomonas arboricola pv. pruni]MDN0301512.1 hypothetical protein [Xanthomonas arboricola pv. pruni]MDN0305633.1 hypothetical protein [Xanthomonas arboricola pv. pruni]